jgi:tRNA(adenine34) deaminase
MHNDDHYMRLALDEAHQTGITKDVPVGAIVVAANGDVIGTGRNRREADGDPTAHAEIVALRAASRAVGLWRLDGATLYVTLEPCAMCAGALVNARVSRLVYGCYDPKAGAVHSLFRIGTDERLNHRFDVTQGVLATECVEVLRAFFADLRARGEK